MRIRSSAVRGRASESASAARSMEPGVIGRIPLLCLLEIRFLFMLCRPPGRYDSNHVVSLSIGHIKNVTINHAYYYEPFFTVVSPIVKKLDGKCIFKDT